MEARLERTSVIFNNALFEPRMKDWSIWRARSLPVTIVEQAQIQLI
jgi:hypothetical protein